MLAPAFNVSADNVATVWLGRWCAGCAWGGKGNKWFLRIMRSRNGRCRMLMLQTPHWSCGIGRYST